MAKRRSGVPRGYRLVKRGRIRAGDKMRQPWADDWSTVIEGSWFDGLLVKEADKLEVARKVRHGS